MTNSAPTPLRPPAVKQLRLVICVVAMALIAVVAASLWVRKSRETPETLIVAAESAAKQGKFLEAFEYCERISDDEGAIAVTARCLAGNISLRGLARLRQAEQQFRRAIQIDPKSDSALEGLADTLILQVRTWELASVELRRIQNGRPSLACLNILAIREQLFPGDVEQVNRLHESDPEAAGPLLALAMHATMNNDHSRARQLLEQAIRLEPELVEAHVRLGRILETGKTDAEFLDWHRQLPATADQHPGIWSVRGMWALEHLDARVAVRCFGEALTRDANLPVANYQLGQLLIQLGDADRAAPFLERTRQLHEYAEMMDPARYSGSPQDRIEFFKEAAERAESLGLLWEAFGWSSLAQQQSPVSPTWAREMVARLQPALSNLALTRTAPEFNPLQTIVLDEYPLPRWESVSAREEQQASSSSPSVEAASVSFEDRARASGIDFTYFNGADPNVRGLGRAYEFSGGGVGILDFDADGWPDLYLTQGSRWPPDPEQTDHFDALYRNLGDGRFENVAQTAGLIEPGYSQGVAVGDFNSDGFPDLYVANIGHNRLFANNGDGTFSDATPAVENDEGRWTSSCLLADLNGDRLPDLYAVNYLSGDDLYTRVCRDAEGVEQNQCAPDQFDGSPDQLFLNLGDGRFRDVSDAAGIGFSNGKGLGILAADFANSGKLDLFVANDGVPNFSLENRTPAPDVSPEFEETAALSGLAYNRNGESEACMGIAAEDFDLDGRIDLFVTNFFDETNTLYHQQALRLFADVTPQTGLREPGISMLGFGTQPIDGELDGLPDLIVANGHLDAVPGVPYEMRPQYFKNRGKLSFDEVPPASLGAYFQGRYRGRSVARIDWNRDGAEDVVISHLDHPVALLTNTTTKRGHSLSVRLHGTHSNRDAIGTIVRVTRTGAGHAAQTRQLTAGDGYQCSNQRLLVFGLGESASADIRVRWPSGSEQRFTNVAADQEITIVEGEPRIY